MVLKSPGYVPELNTTLFMYVFFCLFENCCHKFTCVCMQISKVLLITIMGDQYTIIVINNSGNTTDTKPTLNKSNGVLPIQ